MAGLSSVKLLACLLVIVAGAGYLIAGGTEPLARISPLELPSYLILRLVTNALSLKL